MELKLEKLLEEIPYQWRVQSFSKFKPVATCVAYIDARDVMNRLDAVVSPKNWKDDYKVVGNKFFAGIAIKLDGEWVWKWDTGDESAVEKSKGQVSDSFKRAAVKWGIGRFLYDLDVQIVASSEVKNERNNPYVVDESGKRVYDLTVYINNRKDQGVNRTTTRTATATKTTQPAPGNTVGQPAFKPQPKQERVAQCADCNEGLTAKVTEYSMNRFKRPLCMNCQKKSTATPPDSNQDIAVEDIPF